MMCLMAAASGRAQVSFGPEAGVIFTNYTGKTNGATEPTKAMVSFRVGGVADIGLSERFFFQPGLLYVLNGFKVDYVVSSGSCKVHTLELPLNIGCKFGKPGGDRFSIGVGPYLAFNMGGTLKQTSYGTSESMSIKIGNDANTDNLKRTDVGLGINVAYQLSYGLFIRGHFQQGITNLEPGGDSNNSTFSTNSGISFGYLFGVNKKGKK